MDAILLCLALTVFHEARGEPVVGQQAVAQVVLNRARIRGMSVCEVVLEKGQFSWHPEKYIVSRKNGKIVSYTILKQRFPVGKRGWNASITAAKLALESENTFQNAEFFHAKGVKTDWNRRYLAVFSIGNHVFYARKTNIYHKKYAFLPSSGAFS